MHMFSSFYHFYNFIYILIIYIYFFFVFIYHRKVDIYDKHMARIQNENINIIGWLVKTLYCVVSTSVELFMKKTLWNQKFLIGQFGFDNREKSKNQFGF